MAMQADSKASICMRALYDGPATTAEVVAETGLTPKSACAHLIHLMNRGKITRTPFQSGQCRWLWQLHEGVEVRHAP